ncbi:MAG: hypothetical protein AAGA69_01525 [Pseudomonadota bacterium]
MTALTFGSGDAPLFGVYHPATGVARARRAVLLCNPFGEEAIRAFRPFQKLAERFAAEGVACLRFDYLGTGDSAGDDDLVSVKSMATSILTAHEELVDLSEAREIYWVGLRLGAWAALDATADIQPAGIFLWDPIRDGADYAAHLAALPAAGEEEALGFPVTEPLRAELQSGPAHGDDTVRRKLLATTPFLKTEPILPPPDEEWNSDDALNSFTMPMATIELIVREVSGW